MDNVKPIRHETKEKLVEELDHLAQAILDGKVDGIAVMICYKEDSVSFSWADTTNTSLRLVGMLELEKLDLLDTLMDSREQVSEEEEGGEDGRH